MGTRSSFSVRWFVSLTLFRICWASNIPNMKGSMDRSTPHIRPVLLIGYATCHIKGMSWYWEKSQEEWGLNYLQNTQMKNLIMIGTHSWEQLFLPSVSSSGSRGWHLLASWGSLGSQVSWGSWGSWGSWVFLASRASQASRGSQGCFI